MKDAFTSEPLLVSIVWISGTGMLVIFIQEEWCDIRNFPWSPESLQSLQRDLILRAEAFAVALPIELHLRIQQFEPYDYGPRPILGRRWQLIPFRCLAAYSNSVRQFMDAKNESARKRTETSCKDS
jgi:hypothetical protein